MPGQYSVFATHKGKKAKKAMTWAASGAAVFVVGNLVLPGMLGKTDDSAVDHLRSASYYGVEPVAVADADESRVKQAAAAKQILSSEDKNDFLIVAGMPANPFRGASSAAYGPSNDRGLTINVSSSGSTDDSNGGSGDGGGSGDNSTSTTDATTPSPGSDASTEPSRSGSSPSTSSRNDSGAQETTNALDGYTVGDPSQASPSSGQSMSTESRAAAAAAAKFIKAYTNYDATKTTADAFTQNLPALTPDTRAEVLKQTRSQWDRLAKDHRISEGKVDGEPSMSVPANDNKAIVTIQLNIKEYGQTTNDQYRSSYTITMVKSNNEWLVDGVTANNK